MANRLIPPDVNRCQTEWTEYKPFIMGGNVNQKFRCEAKPVWLATEKELGSDGQRGSMTLCDEHRKIMEIELPNFATFEILPRKAT